MISSMPNTSLPMNLQAAERTQLEQWESAQGTPQQVALRCRIILGAVAGEQNVAIAEKLDRKSTRLNSSHLVISYAVFCLKKKKKRHKEVGMYTHNERENVSREYRNQVR